MALSTINLVKFPYDGYQTERDFTSSTAQKTWFQNLKNNGITIENVQWDLRSDYFYVDISDEILPEFSDFLQYNMAIIKMETDSKEYYFKISSIALHNENSVRIDISMNVFQTFMFDWEFDYCPVDQMHIDRWDSTSNPIINKKLETFINSIMQIRNVRDIETQSAVLLVTDDPIPGDDTNTQKTNFYCFPTRFNVLSDGNNNTISPELDKIIFSDYGSMEESNIFGVYLLPSFPIEYTSTSQGYTQVNVGPGKVEKMVYTYMWDSGSVRALVDLVAFDKISSIPEGSYSKKEVNYDLIIPKPSKPTNNSYRNQNFEPMLFRQPLMQHSLFIGNDNFISIPMSMELIPNIYLRISYFLSKGSVSMKITFINNKLDSLDGNTKYLESSTEIPLHQFDLVTDTWQEYENLRRSEERNALFSQSLTNAINNFVGGGVNTAMWATIWGARTQNPGSKDIIDGGLSSGALKQLGALNMGGAAASSITDGINTWVQQTIKENMIKKEHDIIKSVGNATSSVLSTSTYDSSEHLSRSRGLMKIVTIVPDNNVMKMFDDFYYYFGYNINEYRKPEIRSRKLFNFLRTNGCRIKTTLPQFIKTAIESLFDNGLRVYHTESLSGSQGEYENIEVSII